MLTHRIEPYKAPAYTGGTGTWVAPSHYPNHRRVIDLSRAPTVDIPLPTGGFVKHVITSYSSKLVYAKWIGSLPFKRGDYVVHKESRKPYNQHQINRVRGLQEAQFLIKFDHLERPLALLLVSHLGTRWDTSVDNYEVIDVEQVPEEHRFDLQNGD